MLRPRTGGTPLIGFICVDQLSGRNRRRTLLFIGLLRIALRDPAALVLRSYQEDCMVSSILDELRRSCHKTSGEICSSVATVLPLAWTMVPAGNRPWTKLTTGPRIPYPIPPLVTRNTMILTILAGCHRTLQPSDQARRQQTLPRHYRTTILLFEQSEHI